jgi:hypothetical protein
VPTARVQNWPAAYVEVLRDASFDQREADALVRLGGGDEIARALAARTGLGD